MWVISPSAVIKTIQRPNGPRWSGVSVSVMVGKKSRSKNLIRVEACSARRQKGWAGGRLALVEAMV